MCQDYHSQVHYDIYYIKKYKKKKSSPAGASVYAFRKLGGRCHPTDTDCQKIDVMIFFACGKDDTFPKSEIHAILVLLIRNHANSGLGRYNNEAG